MANATNAGGSEKPRAYPRIWQAIVLIVLAHASTLFLYELVRHFAPLSRYRPEVLGAIHILSIGWVVCWGYRKTSSSFRSVFPLEQVPLWLVVPMLLILLGTMIFSIETNVLLGLVWPRPEDLKRFDQTVYGPGHFWGAFFALIVVTPATEEFLFRGLILHGFLRNYSRKKAVLVSAVLFALFHVSPWHFAGAFLLGLVLAWWLIETGSILPCLFGHALGNALPLALSMIVLPSASHGVPVQAKTLTPFEHIGFVSLGMLLFTIGVRWFRKGRARVGPPGSSALEPSN